MKTSIPFVVLVSKDTEVRYKTFCLVAKRIGFVPKQVESVSDLFALLNDVKNRINLILFDIETLYSSKNTDIFDIINTVSTLTKCSNKEVNPVISVIANEATEPAIIRDAMATDIKGFIFKLDFDTVDNNTFAFKELLAGRSYTDKAILDKIKPSKRSNQRKVNVKVKGIDLTIRQEQILKLICDRGASNKQIARLLNLSESTIKLHIGAILKKYGLRNRTQLALFANSHYVKK